jgi:protein kinase C substrate 80K-H
LSSTYAGWDAGPDAAPGTEAYYSKQLYNRGYAPPPFYRQTALTRFCRLKCWNGPERSVHVDVSCGTANEITHISEPEKCEYRFLVTSPALCWPMAIEEGEGNRGKSEL